MTIDKSLLKTIEKALWIAMTGGFLFGFALGLVVGGLLR